MLLVLIAFIIDLLIKFLDCSQFYVKIYCNLPKICDLQLCLAGKAK